MKQLHEMALALELAGARFLWALKDAVLPLPRGFEDRARVSWVPQTAYMTHCGWGSAIEALQRGRAPHGHAPGLGRPCG